MNIYQKLIEVRKLVEFLQKDTQGYQYRYVAGFSILSKIRPKMDELGLLLTTSLLDTTAIHDFMVKDKSGEHIEHVVKIKTIMTWVNAENPEEQLALPWWATGQDPDIAKAEGKALTYSERYFLLKFFNIATDDEDPDAQQKPKNVQQPQAKKADSPLLEQVSEKAKELFRTPEEYRDWRKKHKQVEDVSKATEYQLTVLLLALKAMNGTARV